MANGYFPLFLEALWEGNQSDDLTDGSLKLVLVDSGYTYSAAHEFFDDVPGSAVVAEYTLENVVLSGGEISADDNAAAFPALTGDTVEEALLYYDSGSDATSRLVARWESASGLPLTTSADDIGVVWSDGYVARLGTSTS